MKRIIRSHDYVTLLHSQPRLLKLKLMAGETRYDQEHKGAEFLAF